MKYKMISNQISSTQTIQMYLRQLLTLAENVFEFKNLNKFIDVAYLNKNLLRKGSIAFFLDEVLGLVALPYNNIGNLDIYGRPTRIQVYSRNGFTRTLNYEEFVIMYDNNGRYPLFLDICQIANRIAIARRVQDINIIQQKTPRIWTTENGNELSLKNAIDEMDAFCDTVSTYKDLNLQETNSVLSPAPYVVDKLDLYIDKQYAEFFRLIGIANLTTQKKERLITDEIQASQGGTIASRTSRFEPRKKAVELINERFGQKLEVKFYDGIPTSNEKILDLNSESEVDEYDI